MGTQKKTFFNGLTVGLIFGDLSGDHDTDAGHTSGLISPLGIDIGLLAGWSFGIGQKFGLIVTPGFAIGRKGFLVVAIGIHYKQSGAIGIVFPLLPLW